MRRRHSGTLLTLVKEIVSTTWPTMQSRPAICFKEIEQDMLEKDIDENAYAKVCLYLTR